MGMTDELTLGERAMEQMNAALGGRLVEEYRRGAEWVLAEIKSSPRSRVRPRPVWRRRSTRARPSWLRGRTQRRGGA
jgi:hypothetical protein